MMKGFFGFIFRAVLFLGALAVIAYVVQKLTAQQNGQGANSGVLPMEPVKSLDDAPLGGQISDELLKILVCPEDKGPLELVDDGKFLLNPRNGYKYPIRNGIPVMLIEEGKKYQDKSLIRNTNGAGKDKSTAGKAKSSADKDKSASTETAS
jgi:uncharacterized protein YbaR (Trm112 family)